MLLKGIYIIHLVYAWRKPFNMCLPLTKKLWPNIEWQSSGFQENHTSFDSEIISLSQPYMPWKHCFPLVKLSTQKLKGSKQFIYKLLICATLGYFFFARPWNLPFFVFPQVIFLILFSSLTCIANCHGVVDYSTTRWRPSNKFSNPFS